jgi:hypothetical protein
MLPHKPVAKHCIVTAQEKNMKERCMRKIHVKSVNGSLAVARHPTTISC